MVMPKIEREAEARNYGKFVISPLEGGYGVTLGNALRRVLLSSLEGVAITSVRFAASRPPEVVRRSNADGRARVFFATSIRRKGFG